MDKSIPCFWDNGCCKVVINVSKNINTPLIGKWYIGIFEIDTSHTYFPATFQL